MNIEMNKDAALVISMLEQHGFEAYIVGGCVRDSVLGLTPKDWDMTTSASPEEIEEVLADFPQFDRGGRKFGTIVADVNGTELEITTYRTDIGCDGRKCTVRHTKSLLEDLARRDFTMNAIAFNGENIVDPFGGVKDIRNKVIKSVGSAEDRFDEDGLRILRALRFASKLGFSLDGDTAKAVIEKKSNLKFVSNDRIRDELVKILLGNSVRTILTSYSEILFEIIPELRPSFGLSQDNPNHDSTVFDHTLRAVESVSSDVMLKIVMLLHDIGKPSTKQMVDGVGKFHGHPAVSAEISTNILERLHFERRFINEALYLIKTHDNDLHASKSACKRFIMNSSIETAKKFMAVRKADIDAQSAFNRDKKYGQLETIANFLDAIESEASVLDRSKLAIKGGDMLAIGLKGPSIKLVLAQILDEVIDETLKNEKDVLIKRAREIAVSLDLI